MTARIDSARFCALRTMDFYPGFCHTVTILKQNVRTARKNVSMHTPKRRRNHDLFSGWFIGDIKQCFPTIFPITYYTLSADVIIRFRIEFDNVYILMCNTITLYFRFGKYKVLI